MDENLNAGNEKVQREAELAIAHHIRVKTSLVRHVYVLRDPSVDGKIRRVLTATVELYLQAKGDSGRCLHGFFQAYGATAGVGVALLAGLCLHHQQSGTGDRDYTDEAAHQLS